MSISKKLKSIAQKQLLDDTKTEQEIADDLQISRSSVQRIKKEMLIKNQTSQQDSIDDNPLILKIQEKQKKKLENARNYEDSEEGWVFSISKSEAKAIGSGRWWTFIVYPESAPADWVDKLRNLHCELAISPLHDRDLWLHDSPAVIDPDSGEVLEEPASRYKCGDLKKSHWHVIIKTEKPSGFKEICHMIQSITNGPCLQKVKSLRGAYEYLAHLNEDHTKKAKYDPDDIVRYNNFVIEPTKTDAARMLVDIFDKIHEQGFVDISQVINYYRDIPEYVVVIGTKAYSIQKGLDAEWRRQNPEGRVQRIQIVEKGEE